ncbi:MAG: GNAT family N-acetyltransferase [Pseudomonadota bacterium]
MTFRRATAADAQNLAALAIQVWLHTYATDGIRSAISQYVLSAFTAETFLRQIHDPSSQLHVAEVNAHLVAYAVVKFDAACPTDNTGNVELATLYVQEHFARAGLGSKLLALGLGLARERGAGSRLWLTVNAQNAHALAFYRKHGFVQAGTTQFSFGGESHLNHVLLEPCAGFS